ncbi:MAG: hypothetical protein AAF800_06870 [Planctomycetota bacterium]
MIATLLAESTSFTDEQLGRLLSGFGKIVFIAIVTIVGLGLLLVFSLARRAARRRRRGLEALMQERTPTDTPDLWSESARRVAEEVDAEAEEDGVYDDEEDDDESDLYGKPWEPGDDEEDEDDEDDPDTPPRGW